MGLFDSLDGPKEARTQKARGVAQLTYWCRNGLGMGVSVPPALLWQDENRPWYSRGNDAFRRFTRFNLNQDSETTEFFARPCPVTPRPGFVDSRIVRTREEADAVYAEALAADPLAEMLIMPVLPAVGSAVLTPTFATIGKGNDGATAGRAGSVSVPLVFTDMPAPEDLIPAGQVPHCEAVFSDAHTFAVQWRSAESLNDAKVGADFVPFDVTVTRIINAHAMDALKLEEECDRYKGDKGTIVWQSGGNPCSHASLHARQNKLPIVYRDNVKVGDELKATVGLSAEPVTYAEDVFRDALSHAAASKKTLSGSLNPAVLWAIHQAPGLCQVREGADFVAYCVVTLWRYGCAAVLGEGRHSRYTRTGNNRRKTVSRQAIYDKALMTSALDKAQRGELTRIIKLFHDDGNWPSRGFGGKAWARCAYAHRELDRQIARCVRGQSSCMDVIAAAHNVVNSAHNNGAFLNKFLSGSFFDYAARGAWGLALQGLHALFKHTQRMHERGALLSFRLWPMPRAIRGLPKSIEAESEPSQDEDESPCDCEQCEPKPKKVSVPAQPAKLHFKYRDNNKTVHIQYGNGGGYLSASIPLATMSQSARDWITKHTSETGAYSSSFAGSSSMYWSVPLNASEDPSALGFYSFIASCEMGIGYSIKLIHPAPIVDVPVNEPVSEPVADEPALTSIPRPRGFDIKF